MNRENKLIDIGPAELELSLGIAVDLREILKQVEADLIRVAMGQAKGSVSGASRLLGIERTTLYEKIRRYEI